MSASFKAAYFGPGSARRRCVELTADDAGNLWVEGDGVRYQCSLSQVRVSARIGSTPRFLTLPDGAKCETSDNEAVDALLARHRRHGVHRLVHRLESGLPYVALTLVATVVIVWASVTYGVPMLAREVAQAVPRALDERLGREGLATLDRVLFEPTRLAPERQRWVRALFARTARHLPAESRGRLEIRSSPRVGANALALPSGIVVVTDDLVRLAQHDAELVAVFAHEIGHIHHRHALRSLLQNSATVLVIAAVTGDFASMTSLSAALPAWLIESSYSRSFELEADAYAREVLREQGIPVSRFADILRRLERLRPRGDNPVVDYLSSHPATDERIERLRGS